MSAEFLQDDELNSSGLISIFTRYLCVSLAAARRRMWTWQHNKQAVKGLLHCSASPLSTSSSSRVSSSR